MPVSVVVHPKSGTRRCTDRCESVDSSDAHGLRQHVDRQRYPDGWDGRVKDEVEAEAIEEPGRLEEGCR